MPSLSLCGRQWALSSDDVPVLGVLGALFHGAWLILLVVFCIVGQTMDRPKDCSAAVELATFMALLLLSTSISTVTDAALVWNGLKGSIMQPSVRKWVELVMYVLTANYILKIGIVGYGTYLVFVQQPQCLKDTSDLDKLVQAVILSTWVITILYLCLFVICYQAFPKNSVLQWKRRIRCVNWCCCGGFDPNESEPLAKMALVLERFFHPLDFSVTDTLTSLILAAKRQSFLRHKQQTKEPLPSYMTTLDEATNGMTFTNRGFQQIELTSRRLTTVSEDAEMDMMELGSVKTDPSCSGDTDMPYAFELDVANDPYDMEVASIRPHHRRTRAIDFSRLPLDFESLDLCRSFETEIPIPLSSPDSLPHADSVPSTMNEELGRGDDGSPAVAVDAFEEDSRISSHSAETTLSWGDELTGPFLIPSQGSAFTGLTAATVDYETLNRMHLYHRYALASYGAFIYLASGKRMVDVFSRCCGLCIKAATSPSMRSRSPTMQRSPTLRQRLNEEAMLRYGFKKENILYRSHEDVLAGHLPYFVALDYDDEAVVVAVRGTWSWSDVVTDFLIHPEPLSEEEAAEVNQLLADVSGFDSNRADCLPAVSVHSGMLRSARGLIRNMQTVGMLEFLETGSCRVAAGQTGVVLPDMGGWKFVMTGHSLGAGVVALATLLLKSRFPQRQIECFAICPPGCTMSPELATAMSPFCYSLVHGKDIIPRISVKTIELLRDQMVRAATLCKKSKLYVLLSSLIKSKWTDEELFFTPELVDTESIEAFRRYRAAARSADVEDLSIAREFIPPGRIVFLRPTKTSAITPKLTKRRQFEAVWISGNDLMKEGILLSLFMIKDHFPYFSIDSLKEVMDGRGKF